MIISDYPQGSLEWLQCRRGVITGSRFKVCRDRLKSGALSAAADLYAMDVARERLGGMAEATYVNAAMRFGTEQEPFARAAYDAAGFICTDDRKFGCSVDGLVDDEGMIEVKTMVSSKTLFKAVVERDISEYIDQVNGGMWLLGRKWCDVILWAPDLPHQQLTVIRINRDDDSMNELEFDLLDFERIVTEYENKLRAVIPLAA